MHGDADNGRGDNAPRLRMGALSWNAALRPSIAERNSIIERAIIEQLRRQVGCEPCAKPE